MMDQPLFMTPRMLDIASRGRYHEVDTTFLKDKDYKYVLHIVPYDETTGKWHTLFRMLTNKLDAAFHNHAFTRWLELMKLHNPAFTIFDVWEALVMDYSEAQFQRLC